MSIDQQYAHMLETVFKHGVEYDDPNRQGVVRKEIPSYTFRHEFKDGFPAISTKKLFFKSVTTELIWFLRGDTNIKYLVDNGCNIWNKDAYKYYLKNCDKIGKKPVTIDRFIEIVRTVNTSYISYGKDEYVEGDLGPVYGHQWRNTFKKIPIGGGNHKLIKVDQIQQLITNMIETPMSSELLVNSWIPTDIKSMALPPCHYGFQIVMIPLSQNERIQIYDDRKIGPNTFRVFNKLVNHYDRYLDDANIPKYGFELHWNQRSCDLFLGVPFNIASYAELALTLQKLTGHKALAIQGDLKKVHLYSNSFEAAQEQLSRECSTDKVELHMRDEFHYITDVSICGKVTLDEIIKSLTPTTFILHNYKPQPPLSVEMLERDE